MVYSVALHLGMGQAIAHVLTSTDLQPGWPLLLALDGSRCLLLKFQAMLPSDPPAALFYDASGRCEGVKPSLMNQLLRLSKPRKA